MAFLSVLNSRSLKVPLLFFSLKAVFSGFLLGYINLSIWGFVFSISTKMTWDFVSGFDIYALHF